MHVLLIHAYSYTLQPAIPSAGSAFTLSSLHRNIRRYRNINRLSIGLPFRVILRTRLTLIRLSLIRKPWSFGVRVSHPHYRYLCLHLLFLTLQQALRLTFNADRNAPLPVLFTIHSFGGKFDARLLSTPNRSTSELLRTL